MTMFFFHFKFDFQRFVLAFDLIWIFHFKIFRKKIALSTRVLMLWLCIIWVKLWGMEKLKHTNKKKRVNSTYIILFLYLCVNEVHLWHAFCDRQLKKVFFYVYVRIKRDEIKTPRENLTSVYGYLRTVFWFVSLCKIGFQISLMKWTQKLIIGLKIKK